MTYDEWKKARVEAVEIINTFIHSTGNACTSWNIGDGQFINCDGPFSVDRLLDALRPWLATMIEKGK